MRASVSFYGCEDILHFGIFENYVKTQFSLAKTHRSLNWSCP